MTALAPIEAHELGFSDIAPCGPPVATRNRRAFHITRHADCLAALKSPFVDTIDVAEELRALQRMRGLTLPSLAALIGGVLFARRSVFHRRGRSFLRMVQETPIAPATMRTRAVAALGAVPQGERHDLVPVLNQLPLLALCDYLGLGIETLHALDELLRRIMVSWGQWPRQVSLSDLDAECETAIGILRAAMEAAARGHGGEGRLCEIRARGTGEHDLSEEEVSAILLFLIIASVETTAGFLANLVILIQRVPGLRELARARDDLRPAIIEEALRFVSPVRRPGRRVTTETLTIGDEVIPSGSALHIDIEAAHRDPSAYPDPWRFDPGRKGPVSLAFSAGAHACLGSKMSRLLSAEVLGAMIAYDIAPAFEGTPDWVRHPGFRIQETLPCVLTARAD